MASDQNKPGKEDCIESTRVKTNSMILKYFLFLFFISILLLGRILWPFASVLVLSFFLAGIFQPVFNFLNRRVSPTFASLLTCGLIIVLVFVPLMFFVGALSQEALSLYQMVKGTNLAVKFNELLQENTLVMRVKEQLTGFGIQLAPEGFSDALSEFAKRAGLLLYNKASTWAANIMQVIVYFFMMIIVIFFLLTDQQRLKNYVQKLSPLPDEEERQLFEKFEEIAGAILLGNGICGLLQGVLGGAVFAFLGLGSPILWGGVMAILAFLPILGIGLVLVPASLILFLKLRIGAAVFMLVFYAVLSFSVEYLLKPKMVGERVKMHTLVVFLSIIGGLNVFGVLGIIYGPLIVTAFLTLADIYLAEYDQYVKGEVCLDNENVKKGGGKEGT